MTHPRLDLRPALRALAALALLAGAPLAAGAQTPLADTALTARGTTRTTSISGSPQMSAVAPVPGTPLAVSCGISLGLLGVGLLLRRLK